MSDEKRAKGPNDTPDGDSVAAQKARAMLSNPQLQRALEDLRKVTPEGEPMFGFPLRAKDARSEVPEAEQVAIEDGAAVIAQREAAAAYVEAAAPQAGASPRMPTGKIKLVGEAAQAALLDPRRQVTQPSLRRAGRGEKPPVPKGLEGEEETSPAPSSRPPPPSTSSTPHGAAEVGARRDRRRIAAALGAAAAVTVGVVMMMRGSGGLDESGVVPSAASTGIGTASTAVIAAPSPSMSRAVPAATSTATATGAPAVTSVPAATSVPSVPAATSVPSVQPAVRPTSTSKPSVDPYGDAGVAPEPTSAPSSRPSATAIPASSAAPTMSGTPTSTGAKPVQPWFDLSEKK
jgi:hypothetical protein